MTKGALRRSRTTWLFSALLVAIFVVAGTGVAGAAHVSSPQARTHKAMTTVHVGLNWLPNGEFAGIWVGIQKGWFRQAGLNVPGITSGLGAGVRYYDYSNTPELENDLCTKQSNVLCVGVDDSSAIPIARQAGQMITGVWAGSQKTPFGFMTCWVPPKHHVYNKCVSNNKVARSGKNITSPKQWKGLRIAYQQDELYVPALMLGSVGLNLSQVTLVPTGFTWGGLTTGKTEDAHLVFINNEPIALRLQGVKTNVIKAYKYGMSAFYADTMFVDDSEMNTYSKQIKAFVGVVDRGWKYAMHNPNTTAAMVVSKYFTPANGGGGPQPVKQQQIEIGQFASTLSRDKAGKIDGRMTLARWNTIIHDLKTYPGNPGGNPIITADIKGKDCFTDKFAPPAAK
jgi:NitT/TauT family transport system substrate-binding protein